MEIKDKVVVVTGGARGIGAAMCRQFVAEGAAGVVVSDKDGPAAASLAKELGQISVTCDVGIESQLRILVDQTRRTYGRIDIFCSNAGITSKGGLECSTAEWQNQWNVNVMSRLFAARSVIPLMLQQGSGYLIHTASAAALLTEIGSAAYSVTKHADLAMAEWLSVCYGRQGIRVSCVCPLGVETDMLDDSDPIHRFLHLHKISASQVAQAVVDGIRSEQFLILPHPQVAEFAAMKNEDRDRWIRAMQRLRQKLTRSPSEPVREAA